MFARVEVRSCEKAVLFKKDFTYSDQSRQFGKLASQSCRLMPCVSVFQSGDDVDSPPHTFAGSCRTTSVGVDDLPAFICKVSYYRASKFPTTRTELSVYQIWGRRANRRCRSSTSVNSPSACHDHAWLSGAPLGFSESSVLGERCSHDENIAVSTSEYNCEYGRSRTSREDDNLQECGRISR